MSLPAKPEKVRIGGREYQIIYVDKPSEVDSFKRESLWGQIDYWESTIRIYDNQRTAFDIWHTIFHEMLHGIAKAYNLKILEGEENHEALDTLAGALLDTLQRNGWLSVAEEFFADGGNIVERPAPQPLFTAIDPTEKKK